MRDSSSLNKGNMIAMVFEYRIVIIAWIFTILVSPFYY